VQVRIEAAPSQLDDGERSFTIRYRYAVCEADRCLIGQDSIQTTIETISKPADDRSAQMPSARHSELIERLRSRLPRDISETDGASLALKRDRLTFQVPVEGYQEATFFPHDTPGVSYGEPDVMIRDEMLTVMIPLAINPNNFRGGPPFVGGLIALGDRPDGPSYEGAVQLEP